MFEEVGDVVGGVADVVVAEDEQRLVLGHRHQVEFGAQHGHEGALAADEGAGHVEAVLGEQRVEVVAGDAAWDPRVAGADVGEVLGDEAVQAVVDLGTAAPGGGDRGALLRGGGADPHPDAVVGEDFEPAHVVDGLAVRLRGGAAGVVADHAAQRAVAVRGRLRPELELVTRELAVEFVQDDAGFDDAGAGLGVDGDEGVAVLRPVDDDGGVGGLAGQAGAAAAGEDGGAEAGADLDDAGAGLDGAGDDDAEGDLTVVRTVGGVCAAAAASKRTSASASARRAASSWGTGTSAMFAPAGFGGVTAVRVPGIAPCKGVRRAPGNPGG